MQGCDAWKGKDVFLGCRDVIFEKAMCPLAFKDPQLEKNVARPCGFDAATVQVVKLQLICV